MRSAHAHAQPIVTNSGRVSLLSLFQELHNTQKSGFGQKPDFSRDLPVLRKFYSR